MKSLWKHLAFVEINCLKLIGDFLYVPNHYRFNVSTLLSADIIEILTQHLLRRLLNKKRLVPLLVVW